MRVLQVQAWPVDQVVPGIEVYFHTQTNTYALLADPNGSGYLELTNKNSSVVSHPQTGQMAATVLPPAAAASSTAVERGRQFRYGQNGTTSTVRSITVVDTGTLRPAARQGPLERQQFWADIYGAAASTSGAKGVRGAGPERTRTAAAAPEEPAQPVRARPTRSPRGAPGLTALQRHQLLQPQPTRTRER